MSIRGQNLATGELSEHSSKDCSSLRIDLSDNSEGERVVWIHNIYNPSPQYYRDGSEQSTTPLVTRLLQRPGEHILLGDFNLHHLCRNNTGRNTCHPEADALLDVVSRYNISLALPEGAVTWRARGCESAIDLTFLTEGAKQALVRCAPREDLHCGSNHLPVYTELNWGWEHQAARPRRAWKKLENKNVAERVQIEGNRLKESLGLPSLDSAEAIDDYLAAFQRGLQRVVEATIPWSRPSAWSKTFWNTRCTEACEEAALADKVYWSCRNMANKERKRKARNNKVAVIKRERNLYFRQAVDRASKDPKGIYGLATYGREKSGKPKELPQFPPLKKKDQQGLAVTFEDKVECLRQVHFPSPLEADLSGIGEIDYPPALEGAGEVADNEIRKAI